MKFEEDNTMTFPNIQNPIIYFLLDNGEVVYVGQSRLGICRPYQHTTRKFDSVSILKCKEEELDYLESKFILKYKPKYNKSILNSFLYSYKKTREMIREQTFFKDFTLFDLKWIIKKIEIETDNFEGVNYIKSSDFEKVISFVRRNENIIKSKSNWKSLAV